MKNFELKPNQVRELFEVLVIAPDLDKRDIARCEKYAKIFSNWMVERLMNNKVREEK